MDADHRKGVIDFGYKLLAKEDLDPVYNHFARHHGFTTISSSPDWVDDHRERWLLAYSMFYHVGVAEHAAHYMGHQYWEVLKGGIPSEPNGGFPRGAERRHFRGHAAVEAIKLMSEYEPKAIVDSWYVEPTCMGVIKNVQRLKHYGPWIGFKLADMGERCLRLPIDFADCELGIYREPRMGAALVKYGDTNHALKTEELTEVIEFIIDSIKNVSAPPWYDRPINIQEAETILCKYKSFVKGHYHVGEDIEAVAKAKLWRPSAYPHA